MNLSSNAQQQIFHSLPNNRDRARLARFQNIAYRLNHDINAIIHRLDPPRTA